MQRSTLQLCAKASPMELHAAIAVIDLDDPRLWEWSRRPGSASLASPGPHAGIAASSTACIPSDMVHTCILKHGSRESQLYFVSSVWFNQRYVLFL
ncbi:hypothetical protein ZWY2020_042073 [Hordeum vulgare]|nr:hypothetical protein ZWY2020_042073 [Hordeum vulgare]